METETRVDDLVDRWEEMRRPRHAPDDRGAVRRLPGARRRRCGAGSRSSGPWIRPSTRKCASRDRRPRTAVADGAGPDRGLPEVLRATAVYRPRGHHDQGGLGEVFAAHQEELDRTVALKRIRPDKLHDAARRRFLREAAITARLQHPGIVPIYGLGQDDDGPFYTMPFIEGQTLQEAIDAFHGDESLRPRPRPAEPAVPRPAPAVHRGLQHGGLCPRPGGRAPRPEAVEHHARPLRRDAGDGLGPGQAVRGGRGGERGRTGCPVAEPVARGRDGHRGGPGHAAVHEPGAGPGRAGRPGRATSSAWA